MIVLALVGAVLGMRYRVLSLVPVTLLAWLLLVVGGLVGESPADRMVLHGVLAALVLQAGYLAATTANYLLAVARARALADTGERIPVPDL